VNKSMNIDRDPKYHSRAARFFLTRLALVAPLLALGCATAPQRVSLYTPFPRTEVWESVERKVSEMGYTTTSSDQSAGVLVAQRAGGTGSESEKQELSIRLVTDGTGNLKLEVLAARVLLAADGSVARRTAARGETTADANEVLAVFLKRMK